MIKNRFPSETKNTCVPSGHTGHVVDVTQSVDSECESVVSVLAVPANHNGSLGNRLMPG